MNRCLIILILLCAVAVSCTETKKKTKDIPLVLREDEHKESLIDVRIKQVLKTLDSFAAAKDVYTARNVNMKMKEVTQEADATCEYFERWQYRLVAASGGKNPDGTIKNPEDTIAVAKLLVQQNGGDSVKRFIDEMQDILLAQVKDSATMRKAITIESAAQLNQNIAQGWGRQQFAHQSVREAVELFEKYIYEVRGSELVILNRILKDAQKRK